MNYLNFLSSKTELKSKNNSSVLIDYRFVIQKKLWLRIISSSFDMKEFFPSQSSDQFSDFLQWMFLSSFDYDWRLYAYVIKYVHYKNHTLSPELITKLLVSSANEWGSDNILESRCIFLYYPNKEKLSVFYEKPCENNLKPKIKICRCGNFEKHQTIELNSGGVFYSISTDSTRLLDCIEVL